MRHTQPSADALKRLGALVVDLALAFSLVYAGRVVGMTVAATLLVSSGPDGFFLFIRVSDVAADLGAAVIVLLCLALLQQSRATPGTILFGTHLWDSGIQPREILGKLIARRITPRRMLAGLVHFGRKVMSLDPESIEELKLSLRVQSATVKLIAWGIFTLISAAIVVTIGLIILSNKLPAIGFTLDNGKVTALSEPSFYVSLVLIAVGWASILAGTCESNSFGLIAAGAVYVYAFVFPSIGSGYFYYTVAPQWLLPILLAVSPVAGKGGATRFIALLTLCLVSVFHTLRLTPLREIAPGSHVFPLVAAFGLLTAAALSRLRIRISIAEAFAAALGVNIFFIASAITFGNGLAPEYVYMSLESLTSIFMLALFLLGGDAVDFCLNFAKTIRSEIPRIVVKRRFDVALVFLLFLELFVIGELLKSNPRFLRNPIDAGRHAIPLLAGEDSLPLASLPLHSWAVLGLLAVAALLSLRGELTRRMSLILLSIWAYTLALVAVYTVGELDLLQFHEPTREFVIGRFLRWLTGSGAEGGNLAKVSALTATAALVVWELLRGPARLPGAAARWIKPRGRILVYLGGLAIFWALLDTSISASLSGGEMPLEGWEFRGFAVLLIPITLYTVLYKRRPGLVDGPASFVIAFALGFVASLVPILLQSKLGEPARLTMPLNLFPITAAEVSSLIIVISLVYSGRVGEYLDSAGTGAAVALGLAAGWAGGLTVPLLHTTITIGSSLTRFRSGLELADFLKGLFSNYKFVAADAFSAFLVLPASLALVASLVLSAKRHEHAVRCWTAAFGVLVAATLYEIPIYQSGGSCPSLTADGSLGILSPAPGWCLFYAAIPAVAIGSYMYFTSRRHSNP